MTILRFLKNKNRTSQLLLLFSTFCIASQSILASNKFIHSFSTNDKVIKAYASALIFGNTMPQTNTGIFATVGSHFLKNFRTMDVVIKEVSKDNEQLVSSQAFLTFANAMNNYHKKNVRDVPQVGLNKPVDVKKIPDVLQYIAQRDRTGENTEYGMISRVMGLYRVPLQEGIPTMVNNLIKLLTYDAVILEFPSHFRSIGLNEKNFLTGYKMWKKLLEHKTWGPKLSKDFETIGHEVWQVMHTAEMKAKINQYQKDLLDSYAQFKEEKNQGTIPKNTQFGEYSREIRSDFSAELVFTIQAKLTKYFNSYQAFSIAAILGGIRFKHLDHDNLLTGSLGNTSLRTESLINKIRESERQWDAQERLVWGWRNFSNNKENFIGQVTRSNRVTLMEAEKFWNETVSQKNMQDKAPIRIDFNDF